MSDFAPGFASRIVAAEHVLQRAFAAPIGFAPAQIDAIGRRAPAAAATPRHFSPADPSANPTEGWNPFDATHGAVSNEPFIDPVQAAHAAGFEEGRAAVLAEMAAGQAREGALLDQVSQALSGASHFDRDRMAAHLRQTVLLLVTKMVGETGVAADVLTARVEAAVDLLADKAESALLRMHPDDVALIDGKLPGNVFAVADPHLARGAFAIESASTIVEDGPDLWLEQLAQTIDRIPIPPIC